MSLKCPKIPSDSSGNTFRFQRPILQSCGQLNVSASMVSRVAAKNRDSTIIEAALNEELDS
jgi:hypothetical protein